MSGIGCLDISRVEDGGDGELSGTLYLRLSNLVNHEKYRDAMGEVWITDELVRIYEKMQDIDARESQHPSVFCINIVRPTPVP